MEEHPELPFFGRTKLIYNWLPMHSETLLDAGCSYGYATRFFAEKATKTYGLEPSTNFINIAQKRYPDINFHSGGLEKTPYEAEQFDTIVLADVFEHVQDEMQSLNELHRILKQKGILIMTVPHKGLFGFLDPGNYRYLFFELLIKLKLYKVSNKFVRHRHYSRRGIIRLLEKSSFKNHFVVKRCFRSGLVLSPFVYVLGLLLKKLFGQRIATSINRPFVAIKQWEYWISFGFLAYNIALKIEKKTDTTNN